MLSSFGSTKSSKWLISRWDLYRKTTYCFLKFWYVSAITSGFYHSIFSFLRTICFRYSMHQNRWEALQLIHLCASTKIKEMPVRELVFADDLVLEVSSIEDMQCIMAQFSWAAHVFGIKINTSKTKLLYQIPLRSPIGLRLPEKVTIHIELLKYTPSPLPLSTIQWLVLNLLTSKLSDKYTLPERFLILLQVAWLPQWLP